MSKRLLGSALIVDWRAQLPRAASQKARSAWRVFQSAQIINWRAQMGPTSSGGGAGSSTIAGEADGAGGALCALYVGAAWGEADGAGTAQCAIVGPAVDIPGEADGAGQAQCSLRVGQSLRGEADGQGQAQCFLGGGVVSILCLTTGSVAGSTPTPKSTVLYDAPASF